jgi:hypothetical protein
MQTTTPDIHEKQLPLSQRDGFVPLPSDPAIRLTPEQLDSLFRGDKQAFIRDVLRLSAERQADEIA